MRALSCTRAHFYRTFNAPFVLKLFAKYHKFVYIWRTCAG